MIEDPEDPSPVLVSLIVLSYSILISYHKKKCVLSLKSGPTFVPMKTGEELGQPTSIVESTEESTSRSVRFNGVVEVSNIFRNNKVFQPIIIHGVQVRELSPNDAVDALMARLSYSASIRAEVATRRCAEKLSSLETMKVAATFSLLVLGFRCLTLRINQ